jgi:predicted RNA-binding protein Jag
VVGIHPGSATLFKCNVHCSEDEAGAKDKVGSQGGGGRGKQQQQAAAAAKSATAAAAADNGAATAGWKEVVRKSKKVSVPSNAISRVIGRGGSNINAIRYVTILIIFFTYNVIVVSFKVCNAE